MTGCGTERYADWFFDLDGTLVDSAPDILRLLGGVLREEGLVSTRRAGKQIYYAVADAKALALLHTLYQLYCPPPENRDDH